MSSQVVWMSRGKLLVWTGMDWYIYLHECFFCIHVGNYTLGPTGCSKKLCQKKNGDQNQMSSGPFCLEIVGWAFRSPRYMGTQWNKHPLKLT